MAAPINRAGEPILASAARTATVNSDTQTNDKFRGGHVIIDVTAATDTPSVTPKIQGLDPLSGKWYDLLEGAAITGTGTTVLKVYPGITAAANVAVSDLLPAKWRVTMTHGDADSITYSVAFNGVI